MAYSFGSQRRQAQHETDEYKQEQCSQASSSYVALPAQSSALPTSQANSQCQLRSHRSQDVPSRRAGSLRKAKSTSSSTNTSPPFFPPSTSSTAQGQAIPSKSRLARALGLLCAASSLASGFSPIAPVSARSLALRRHATTDFKKTSFTAGIVGQSDEQQSSQLEQRRLADVAEVIFEGNGSDIAALRTPRRSPSLIGRWGHSATYLESEKTILFVGGQVANGSSLTLTNDVFALNVSSLVTNTTSGPQSPWQRLGQQGLEPHAFAGQALTQTSNGTDQIWLFGGYTNNCSASSAWTWTAGEGVHTSWMAVGPTEGLTRKARAPTMGVPATTGLVPGLNATGSAVMMLGGSDVSKECSTQSMEARGEKANSTVNHDGAVVWQMRGQKLVSVREMAVNDAHGSFSLVDYSTVTVPAKGLGNSTIFFGGMTSSHVFANWTTLWSFNPWTSTWQNFSTTGEVPSGRRGHSTTLISGNRVIVAGGILANGTITNDVYVLDLNKTPAAWSKPTYAKRSEVSAPAKAYHSAILINEILIVGFGASHNSTAASEKSSSLKRAESHPTSSMFYLDTSKDGAWRWSSSIDEVLEGRGVVRAVTSTAASRTSTTTSSTSTTSRSSTSDTTTSSSSSSRTSTTSPSSAAASSSTSTKASTTSIVPQKTSFSAAPAESTSVVVGAGSSLSSFSVYAVPTSYVAAQTKVEEPSSSQSTAAATATNTSDGSGSNKTFSTAEKTGAVVGSLLGAAAFAVVLGGLYAYKKRRDSYKEWAGGDAEGRNGGAGGGSGAVNAPPVSMLWFHDPKKNKNGNDGEEDSFTRKTGGRPRLSGGSIRTGFVTMDPFAAAAAADLARPDQAAFSSVSREDRLSYDPYRLPPSPLAVDDYASQRLPLDRNQSSETLASIGGASHCSYPYLSAMHRPSLGGSQPSPNPSSATVTPALSAVSPRAVMAERAAGFVTSPISPREGSFDVPHRFSARDMIAGWNPQIVELKSARDTTAADDSFESIVIDMMNDEGEEEDEQVAELGSRAREQRMHVDLRDSCLFRVDSGSQVARATRTDGGRAYSLPHHPRLAKTLSTSSVPAAPRTMRVTSNRAKRSMLRVTNASLDVDQ